ncbi:MAG: hypothetical protein CK425_00750 [Parachlamydia sp.]|nr:MAG: hypothetical protein CK425_00750 [Parachlamydia sp.]
MDVQDNVKLTVKAIVLDLKKMISKGMGGFYSPFICLNSPSPFIYLSRMGMGSLKKVQENIENSNLYELDKENSYLELGWEYYERGFIDEAEALLPKMCGVNNRSFLALDIMKKYFFEGSIKISLMKFIGTKDHEVQIELVLLIIDLTQKKHYDVVLSLLSYFKSASIWNACFNDFYQTLIESKEDLKAELVKNVFPEAFKGKPDKHYMTYYLETNQHEKAKLFHRELNPD